MDNRWEWMAYSACRNEDPRMFDNEEDAAQPPERVKNICVSCSVRTECLALHKYDNYGIWGGTTKTQREELRAEHTQAVCPACIGTLIYRRENTEVCLGCGISWISNAVPVRL